MTKVEVIWNDIISGDGWHTADELDEFNNERSSRVFQVGYLYEEDERQIILLDSYFEDKELFGNIHIIPRGCVEKITYL